MLGIRSEYGLYSLPCVACSYVALWIACSTCGPMAKPKKRNVELEIAAANAELKLYGCPLTIERRVGRSKLSLRGKLPPKEGDGPYKRGQRIPLGVGISPAAIAFAKAEALRLGALVEKRQFSWAEVGKASAADTCAQAIEKFRKDWARTQQGTVEAKEKRFHQRFWNRGFSKLPQQSALSAAVLEATLNAGWELNTAGRKIAAQNLARLAEFSGIEGARLEGGKYGTGSVKRDVPSDDEIEAAINGIVQHGSNHPVTIKARDGWQWIAGMMAAYGLRNHEAFACDLGWEKVGGAAYLVCSVRDEAGTNTGKTKTGSRKVLPLPNRWVELWELDRVRRPNVNGDYGGITAKQFKRMKLGFQPYTLRHAWNIRCALQTGIAPIVRYSMMGHSQQTNEIYQRHLRDSQVLEGFVRGLED